MPYGFYELVRFIALIILGILAFDAHQKQLTVLRIIYVSLALLFQPFFKIALGRDLWNVVDVLAAILLVGSLFFSVQNKSEKKQH